MHLRELQIFNACFDLTTLEQAHPVPILSVRTLVLDGTQLANINPSNATLCSLISNIFPNVEKLHLFFRAPSRDSSLLTGKRFNPKVSRRALMSRGVTGKWPAYRSGPKSPPLE